MKDCLDGYRLCGPNFRASIAVETKHPTGIVLLNKDPRKVKNKPDAYAGIVLDTGDRCKLVKIGDNIVFERWDWKQVDLPNEMILSNEREVLVVNDVPVNDCVIFELEDFGHINTKIIVPQTLEKKQSAVLSGKVLSSSYHGILPGERYIFEKLDSNQYYYGDGRLAFRVQGDWNFLATYELENEKVEA